MKVYHGRLMWQVTTGVYHGKVPVEVYHGRLLWKVPTDVYCRRLPWKGPQKVTAGGYHFLMPMISFMYMDPRIIASTG